LATSKTGSERIPNLSGRVSVFRWFRRSGNLPIFRKPGAETWIELERFRALVAHQVERISQNHFIREEDIRAVLSLIREEINLHVITRHGGSIIHRLSYRRRNGHLVRLPLNYRDPAPYHGLLASRGIEWRHGTILLIARKYQFPEDIRADIQRHVNVLITQTQVWRNLRKDATQAAIKDFQSDLAAWGSRSVKDLAQYIARRFQCRVAMVNQVRPQKTEPRLFFRLAYSTEEPPPNFLCYLVQRASFQNLCNESLRVRPGTS
jgi:hypothetical protein